jgi:riboflavin biosynthesis pyrimidine reductase
MSSDLLDHVNSTEKPFESRANLLIDPSFRVAEFGRSKSLSSSEDRARFHALRNWADLIIVGSATFKAEPYSKLKIPIQVYSRSDREILDWNLEFTRLAERYGRNLLIEAGPGLLQQIIISGALDQLHLTRTLRRSSDLASPVFDSVLFKEIESSWLTTSDEKIGEDRFTVFRRH